MTFPEIVVLVTVSFLTIVTVLAVFRDIYQRIRRLERINRSLEIRLEYLEQDARFYLTVKS